MLKWLAIFFAGLLLVLQGCTYRSWYEGLRETARQECYKNKNDQQIRECLDKTNVTYEEYEKNREELKK
ncbi:MAG: hypothetical protein K9K75_04865 [Deltaproteobacteria bacterium]|nr:hypothetical protein [Deltaproteobacteria bacterium]